jgi:hypothetical protein
MSKKEKKKKNTVEPYNPKPLGDLNQPMPQEVRKTLKPYIV